MQRQQGFTLIELMIVIAIVGILAAIALPAYQDYTVRAKMSEPLAMLAEAKTSIAEYYVNFNAFPGDQASSGVVLTRTESQIVDTITYDSSGTITALIASNAPGMAGAAGQSFLLSPTTNANGSLSWTCRPATGMPAKYLPSTCR
ncbi:pilin [Congregibacter sp.]|nr:pilin [Congregibacter sp.]